MNWLKDPRKRAYVAMAVLALLVAGLAWPFVVARDARHLSAYRPDEEDLSRYRGELQLAGATVRALGATPRALSAMGDPERALLVVVGPERRYDPGEAQAVVDFLRAGGTVLLADETGFGTDVARAAGYAFSPQRVLDSQNFRGDPNLVVATATLDGQPYRVVFNAPASVVALTGAAPADTLAASSPAKYPEGSYADANGNGEIDIQDQPGPFPLVVRTAVGRGTLILVADTGLFMNAQLGLSDYDNARFLGALARAHVPADGVVVIDESRHAPDALVAPWAGPLRALGRVAAGAVAPWILLGLLVAGTLAAWRLTRPTEDWSRHRFELGAKVRAPGTVRPDVARAQRMARRSVSEKYNLPMEQVAAMTTEQLLTLTGDRTLAEIASGAHKSDPAPFFQSFSQEGSNP